MDDFQQAFNDADVVVALPVYAAGEAPIDGVSSAALVAGLKRRGHRSAVAIDGAGDLVATLLDDLRGGDMVICLGAGDITKTAAALAGELTAGIA
jgi:UDP-N-acetylmuramate--alanine ligase